MPRSRRTEVVGRYGSLCWLCEVAIDLELRHPHPDAFTVDHVQPRSRGGSNRIENLRPAHNACNVRRGAPTYRRGGLRVIGGAR